MKTKSATFSDKALFVEDESCLETCHGQFVFHSPRAIKLVLYNNFFSQPIDSEVLYLCFQACESQKAHLLRILEAKFKTCVSPAVEKNLGSTKWGSRVETR